MTVIVICNPVSCLHVVIQIQVAVWLEFILWLKIRQTASLNLRFQEHHPGKMPADPGQTLLEPSGAAIGT